MEVKRAEFESWEKWIEKGERGNGKREE